MKKLLSTCIFLALSSHAMAEDQFKLSTGFDFSSGKYGGTTTTDILYIPVTGKYETDDWIFKLTVPYISITGTSGVIRGMGRIGPGKAAGTMKTASNTQSGLGDVTASADYNFYDDDALSFDIVGSAKLGTANANQGLGTGKNDYAVQLDMYYLIVQSTLFATVGHKTYGSPAGTTLNDIRFGTLGISQKMGDTTSAGLMMDYAESPSTTSANSSELTFFITERLSDDFKLQANLMKGFSNGSPDFGGGLTVTALF
jgi:hypothetical protein